MKRTDNKSGGVLVMVVLVILVFSTLAIGLFKLAQTDAVEAVYVEQSNQAFWLAESGVQRALDHLRTSPAYLKNPYGFDDIIGEGTNMVHVSKMTTPDTWYISSTGTVGAATRIIELKPVLSKEIGYAIMGLNGDSTLNKDGTIDGHIYNFGELWVNGRAAPAVDGDILTLDARNITEYDVIEGNDKVEMEIDSSAYNLNPSPSDSLSYIYIDASNNVVAAGTTNSLKYIDLTGANDVVVAGDLDVDADVAGTWGDGTLVVQGDLKLSTQGDPYTISDGATILVSENIWAQKDGYFGSDVLVYAGGDMTVKKTGTGTSTTFMVKGNFSADSDLDFKGLIFADGEVQIDGNLTLEGTLIAGSDFWLKGGYDITYNADYIPDYILENMILYVLYSTDPGTWNEVSSL